MVMANLIDRTSTWKITNVVSGKFLFCTLTLQSVMFLTGVMKYGGVDSNTFGNIMSKML